MINRKEHLSVSQPTLKDGKEAHGRLEAEIDAGLLRDETIGYFKISVSEYHPRVIDAVADLYKLNGWGVEILQWGSFMRDLTLAIYW